MTMKGEPVPPEGLDHIKALQKGNYPLTSSNRKGALKTLA